MKLLILFVIASNSFCEVFSKLHEDNAIENLYIDILVQRYMSLESALWNYVYNSGAKSKDIIFKIRSEHSTFLSNPGLAEVMNNEYKSRFENILNLTIFDNYAQEDPMVVALAEQPHGIIGSDAYMKSEMITNIYNRIVSKDLFQDIKEGAENQNCSNRKISTIESASQDLFKFYEIITASMLISYVFAQRINMVQVVKRGFEEHDYTILKNRFNTRYSKIAELARENIQTSSKVVWMCDIDFYIKEDESIQITNFLNGYIDHEINLNQDGSCWNSCEDFRWTRNYRCSDGTFCDQQRKIGHTAACDGTVVDCSYIDSGMTVCPSVDRASNRRYDYINFDSGRHFGRHVCPSKKYHISSWWNIFLMRCSYCFCYCDSHVDSDRYFSLQPAVSTIRKNKIITGVGIVKRNGIFSWKIIQSKLLSNGRVQQSPYNESNDRDTRYQPSEEKLSDDEREEIVQNFKRTDFGIFEGVDYHTLSWQNRSINLATVTVPNGCVVTGIKFTVIKEHLNFEIRSTQFNFNTGLLYGRSEWISNKNERRSVLLLDRPEPSSPIHLTNLEAVRSIPDFRPNQYIKFRPSDPDKDAGQTTVPFIDNQLVRPKELTLLSGVGIYYKGRSGYGGFVAPKIILYDMSSYLGN